MTHAPTVSAVIPVHNGEAFVGEAVRSALEQTRPALECIVIDDGSTDATREIIDGFGDSVRYIRQHRGGVSRARNRGAREAHGELVAFLDHDDVWLPDKLERQVGALRAHQAMALCAVQVIDAHGRPQLVKRLAPVEGLVAGMLLFTAETVSCSSTGLVRRHAFEAMGGFDPALSMSADWDLLLRMLLEAEIAYVDEPLVGYRVHGSNMSRRIDTMERDMLRAFGKAFAHPALPPPIRARRSEAYGRLYRMLAGSYRDVGDGGRAFIAVVRAIRHHPVLLRDMLRDAGP